MKSYIYGIFHKGECLYIGSSFDYKKRWKQHKSALEKGKHTNKTLQKYIDKIGINNIEFEVLWELNTDNTLIKFMFESLYNSLYKPKCNKCVIQQGRNKVILQRCNKDVAEKLIEDIKKLYFII